jgi:hypothetical protein
MAFKKQGWAGRAGWGAGGGGVGVGGRGGRAGGVCAAPAFAGPGRPSGPARSSPVGAPGARAWTPADMLQLTASGSLTYRRTEQP